MRKNVGKSVCCLFISTFVLIFSGCNEQQPVQVNNYYITNSDGSIQQIDSDVSVPVVSNEDKKDDNSSDNIKENNTVSENTAAVDSNLSVGVTYTVTGTNNYLALRNAPAYDGYNEIAKLLNGDEVTIQSQNVYGDNGDYCYVTVLSGSAKNKIGYVNKNYLKKGALTVSNSSSKAENSTSKLDSTNSSETVSSEIDSLGKSESADIDYPSIIRGNLTKAQLELVLSRVTNDMARNGMSESDSKTMALYFANSIISSSDSYGLYNGGMEKHWAVMNVNDFNRLFSSFCDYKIDDSSDYAYNSDTNGTYASDDTLYVALASTSDDANAEVTGAEYNGDELIIYYHYHYWRNGSSDIDENRKAVLYKSSDGLYKIDSIE